MESTASSLETCVGEEIADIQTPAKLQNATLLPHCKAHNTQNHNHNQIHICACQVIPVKISPECGFAFLAIKT